METSDWIKTATREWQTLKVLHPHYVANVRRLQLALFVTLPGEIITLVGPSRVGKTRSLREAAERTYPPNAGERRNEQRPVVFVEAENASQDGAFSTKAFMVQCLRAIEHPIYGLTGPDDPWHGRTQSRAHRATEAALRDAFEIGLRMCGTEVLIVDEAHHISYVRGGPKAAAQVLDSLKCLANKTQVKLVLTGAYSLLDLLALAPHLLGRQQPLEFPRYRLTAPGDVKAWKQVLLAFNNAPIFADRAACAEHTERLDMWAQLLYNGSLGCVGHLSRWLRAALIHADAEGLEGLNEAALLATRLPDTQAAQLAADILAGERTMTRATERLPAPQRTSHSRISATPASSALAKSAKRRQAAPFQRNVRRSPRGGRG